MSSFLTFHNEQLFQPFSKGLELYFDYKPTDELRFHGIPVCKRAMRQLIHPTQFTIKEKEPAIGKYSI